MDTKLLKQKILDLAIRGKLVPQDPNDEPASVLLERIRAEREQLIKQGKLKRSKSTSDNQHYQNVPFEIPASWEWVELPDVCSMRITDGTHQTPAYSDKENGIPFLSSKDVTSGKINWSGIKYITKELHEELYKRIAPQRNDILLAKNGTTGVAALVDDDTIFDIYVTLAVIRPSLNVIYPPYLLYQINSPFCKEQFNNHLTGIGLPNLHLCDINKTRITLPPLAEQKRIVIELERWLTVIDSLENNNQDLLQIVAQTKSKILDLAIHGKLVAQDPNDEPASELLRRIASHATPCDTSHYENLPKTWCVAHMGDVYNHTTGKALKKTDSTGELRQYITTSNVYWNNFDFTEVRSMYFTEKELDKCTAHKGDLLVCNGGDVGRAAIWDYDYDICYQNHISRLRSKSDDIVFNPFYSYLFRYLKDKGQLNGKGVAITSLSAVDIQSLPIPLPPLFEQKRIVERIETIFAQLDSITAEL